MKDTTNVSDMLRAIRGLIRHGWTLQYSFTFQWTVAHTFYRNGRLITIQRSY